MSNEQYKEAGDVLVSSIGYMIDEAKKINTLIFNGIIVSISGDNYTIKLNGMNYVIPHYGSFTHTTNDIVKVFIPQGNMNLAFFI